MSAASSLSHPGGNERFNAEAAAWDSNPFVHAASSKACDALLQRFPTLRPAGQSSSPQLDVLEIGCGTGLLTFMLAPYVKRIVAIDAARGMIDVLKRKVQESSDEGVRGKVVPLALLLEDPEDERLPATEQGLGEGRAKFDLICSHLVLHHVPPLEELLKTMLGCLKSGGSVALTDFEDYGPEAKRFHPKAKMGGVERHGIPREGMAKMMGEVGFKNVRVERGFALDKRVERHEGEFGDKGKPQDGQGEIASFPFVLCMGERG
jgi:SAM-dependent methyltransferase